MEESKLESTKKEDIFLISFLLFLVILVLPFYYGINVLWITGGIILTIFGGYILFRIWHYYAHKIIKRFDHKFIHEKKV